AFELYKNGYSDKEVQNLTGINHETFRRYRIKHNIQRNI
ncbi:TPA: recombinase family protein, partial [Enterococcus faecium]